MSASESAEFSDRGVVGERQLLAVQIFDVARLTTHVVPIVPGTFIAVSGIGPDGGSNGSGKTSFLSAVSILLADPQWRLESNGGRFASGILFKPDAAGISKARRIQAAPYGYVVGVFAHPDDPSGTAVTVWVRIAVTAPYVQARYANGLHVADAGTDAERILQADSLWNALGSRNTISARRMAQELYGLAPRCLTYLDTPLRPAVPSLLSQQMTKMEPHDIGDSLIALSGLKSHLDEEEHQRDSYLGHQRDLENAEQADAKARIDEEADLAGIRFRLQARDAVEAGQRFWYLYLTRRCQEVSEQQTLIAQEISDQAEAVAEAAKATHGARDRLQELQRGPDLAAAEVSAHDLWQRGRSRTESVTQQRTEYTTRLALLAQERARLASKAEGWNGATPEDAAVELSQARQKQAAAAADRDTARGRVHQAEDELARAESGRVGAAGNAIDLLAQLTPPIAATALFDELEISDNARAMWEPRLWSWRHAAVVSPADAQRAQAALEVIPGTQIVMADDPNAATEMPDGIHSDVPVGAFLATLADRFRHQQTPPLARDEDLKLSITGGFEQPTTGREALIREAAEGLQVAQAALSLTKSKVTTTEAQLDLAQLNHEAAEAAARLSAIANEEEDLTGSVKTAETQLIEASGIEADLENQWKIAVGLAQSQAQLVEVANLRFQKAERAEKGQRDRLSERERALGRLQVPDWQALLLGVDEDREAGIPANPADAQRPVPSLYRSASEKLLDALHLCGSDSDPGSPLPGDLGTLPRIRDLFADQDPAILPEVRFEDVAGPLLAMLDSHADSDQVTTTRIAELRETRRQSLETLRYEVTKAAERLEVLQDMIESHVEGILRRISDEFDNLNRQRGGSGAEVHFASLRPTGPGPWPWEVTPRWRRSPSGDMVSYREIANGAQVKISAVQLVLAALLADQDTHGRVLILDELGNSLDDFNRKDVLSALRTVAGRRQVTILGTCQDSVLADAAEVCGELLWFTHASESEPYNRPTHVWGYDSSSQRVKLTADWVRAGRGLV